MRIISSLCLLSVLTSCAGQQMQQRLHAKKIVKRASKKTSITIPNERQEIKRTYSSLKKKSVRSKANAKKEAERTFSSMSNGLLDLKDDLQLEYHPKLFKFWVNYFSNKKNKKNKERFIRQMKNGEKYRTLITRILKKHGLPADLFYVGLIESGFNTHIRSHADAVGPWQFIKGTATRYGLRVDRYVDERRNIHKATEAAAGYFKDLYNIFGSWELALCAYNAGEYRIINAIRKGNTRDYRKLVEKKLIPKETIYYVPKVAAARYLSKHRRRYKLPVRFERGTFYKSAERKEVKKSFSLTRLSKDLRVSHKTMKKLNPDYKGNWIKVGRKGQSVIIPKNTRARFANLKIAKKNIRKYSLRSKSGSKRTPRSKRIYKVRRGDNLYSISKKYGTTVSKLKSFNKIKGSHIRFGQRLKIPSRVNKSYVVRNGDNLTHIARKFKTSISTITAYNKIRNNRIYRGQRIYLP